MQESIGMKTLELVFFDAGGGHRSAANALCEVVRHQNRPWDMQMMNLQELLDDMDVFRKITGIRLQDLYNLMLRAAGPRISSADEGCGVIRLYHGAQVKLLVKHWRDRRPDMVVSLIPNFNRALYRAIERRAFPWSRFSLTWPITRPISGSSASRNTSSAAQSMPTSRRFIGPLTRAPPPHLGHDFKSRFCEPVTVDAGRTASRSASTRIVPRRSSCSAAKAWRPCYQPPAG